MAEGEIATNGPNWLELPREVTEKILGKIELVEIVMSASQVCSLWWNICKNPLLWRFIKMTKHSDYPDSIMVEICRRVVNWSRGHLEGISIEYFATDDLLKQIADSASQLRLLNLPSCDAISNEAMIEVAKKLPMLEFLDISYTALSARSLETIGSCCPLLKELRFISHPPLIAVEAFVRNDEAFAIAKTMPELRLLHIPGNNLSNDGLLAILDGCPLLVSLDLRACHNVSLSGSLEKRCLEQVKDIGLPENFRILSPEHSPSDIDPDWFFNFGEMMEYLPTSAELIESLSRFGSVDDEFSF